MVHVVKQEGLKQILRLKASKKPKEKRNIAPRKPYKRAAFLSEKGREALYRTQKWKPDALVAFVKPSCVFVTSDRWAEVKATKGADQIAVLQMRGRKGVARFQNKHWTLEAMAKWADLNNSHLIILTT